MASKGKVYIVGAGPGDPSLITLRGIEILERADVVLYDRLASKRLLSHAPESAELVSVGKRSGGLSMKQDEINEIMARHARRGRIVVRLKGGDPLVFGRGGEEADFLAERGIDFEIVPGVSAACGAAAFTGVPLTDRRKSSLVTFVTAREGEGASAGVDWAAVAKTGGTIAIYMGRGNLAETARRLVDGGLDESTPCIVVERASERRQRTVSGTIAEVASKADEACLEPPCIVITGAVAAEYPTAAWFEKLPLYGKRLLLTRPEDQQESLSAAFEALGADVIRFPTTEIVPVPPEELSEGLSLLADAGWVVFTSANGVATFLAALDAAGRDARALGGRRIAAIGSATAASLEAGFLKADVIPEEFTSRALLAKLIETSEADDSFLLWRADAADPELAVGLRDSGRSVVEFTAYRIRKPPQPDEGLLVKIMAAPPDAMLFSSGLTARNFVEMLTSERALLLAGGAAVVSIGPVTTAALEEVGIAITVEARPHNAEGLLAATLAALGGVEVPGWLRL